MPIGDPAQEVSNHVDEVLQLLDDKDTKSLSAYLEELHPVEVVSIINSIDAENQLFLFKHITGLDQLAEVIILSNEGLRHKALSLLDDPRIAAVIRRLEVDDAVDLIALLPRRRQVRVLKRLSAESVKEITSLLAYDQDTAGGIMNTRFLSVPPDISAEEAIQTIRSKLAAEEIEDDTDFFYFYVLDRNDCLLGTVSMKELLSAAPEVRLEDIMCRDVITASPEDDQEGVARVIADYDLSAIPVIAEDSGKMIGIVSVDDCLDVLVEEHNEDLLKLAGTEDNDVIGASVRVAVRSRLPWLIASWMGGIGGAMLLGNFSSTLQQVVALAFFMPVVFGMGGNVGSQSSTITVRGLATGELGTRRVSHRLRKEAAVGIVLGIFFGILLACAALILYGEPRLSIIVGISISVTMTCAAALGSMLPVIFKRLGFDPAIASGPFVTTSTDILSITIYFTVATLLLR
jgi:magnesium transporter